MPKTDGTMPLIECSFFEHKKACSVCGISPVMKAHYPALLCAEHGHDEPGHALDWVDCYTGCLKHDTLARRRFFDRRSRARLAEARTPEKGQDRHAFLAQRKPVPNLSRLALLTKHASPLEQNTRISKLLVAALSQRQITPTDIVKHSSLSADQVRYTLGSGSRIQKTPHTLHHLVAILDYLKYWEQQYREELRREQ